MRLIDADALIQDHFSYEHRIALSEANKAWMRRIINEAPTIEPEIIRCKKCRYKKRKGVDYFCDHITGVEIMVSPNDYCSWAERGTDG
jgi:hypothetical protein